MKHVVKTGAPASFETWKADTNAVEKPTFENLRNPLKSEVRAALLADQKGVCCYCGVLVNPEDCHIEHFQPQDPYKDKQLDYGNLFVSCIRQNVKNVPAHCGHAKDNGFDEVLAISPLDPGCERRFIYTQYGNIRPRHLADARACYMQDLLALDTPLLRRRRLDALSGAFDLDDVGAMTAADIERIRDWFGQPRGNGSLHSFSHVIVRYAEQLLADYLHLEQQATGTAG